MVRCRAMFRCYVFLLASIQSMAIFHDSNINETSINIIAIKDERGKMDMGFESQINRDNDNLKECSTNLQHNN